MIDAKELEEQKTEQKKQKIENNVCIIAGSILIISMYIIGGRLISLFFTFLFPELEDYGIESLIFFSIVLAFVFCAIALYRIRNKSVEDYKKMLREDAEKEAERQKKIEDLKYQEYTRKAAKNCKRYINSNGL